MGKLIKFISDILLIVLIIIVGAITVPKLLGISPLMVVSGSMEPTYHVGSLIYVKKTLPENINTGDAITYRLTTDTLVTHRVVEKDEKTKSFITKGDANNVNDGSVLYSQLVGKVIFCIPYLGYAAAFLATHKGVVALMSAIILLLILSFLPDIIKKSRKREGNNNEQKNLLHQ